MTQSQRNKRIAVADKDTSSGMEPCDAPKRVLLQGDWTLAQSAPNRHQQ